MNFKNITLAALVASASLAADMNAVSTVAAQENHSARPAASKNKVQTYSLAFIDEIYTKESREVVKYGDASPVFGRPKDPSSLRGDSESVKKQYESLKRSGSVPDLGHLESALEDIADKMLADPYYVKREFTIFPILSYPTHNIIAAEKKVMINGKPYRVFVNAIGMNKQEKFYFGRVMQYSIESSDGMELRQIQNNFERWWAPVSIDGKELQRRTVIFGSEAPEMPDFTGIKTKITNGFKYQIFN